MTLHQQPVSDEELSLCLSRPLRDDDGLSEPIATGNAELHNLQTALRCYRGETLQWAERRSAAQPSLAALARKQDRWAALPRWSLALVAVVTIAGGVAHLASSLAVIEQPPAASDAASPLSARSSTPADIAEDNELLSSIDEALSYHAASPVDSLNLRSKPAGSAVDLVPGVPD